MIKNPTISIVIPCYNCADTLEEAVNSCFTQELSQGEFEIIMVDDGSADSTAQLMKELAANHPEISLIFHEKNKGGGAARNTGIKAAKGTYVYCLDSDNFFGKGSLKKMAWHIESHSVDGVVFHEQRFFEGNDSLKYSSRFTDTCNQLLTIEDLFVPNGAVVDNFLFTKASYLKTEGYPEHHDFDTQGFEVRYLAAGNKVITCPDSVFYHRMVPKQPSYFERAYNKGLMSINYYLILEEIFDLLSNEAKKTVAEYDIFTKSSLQENLSVEMQRLEAKKNFIKKEEIQDASLTHFSEALRECKNGNHAKSLELFKQLQLTIPSQVIQYNIVRNEIALSGIQYPRTDREAIQRLRKDGIIKEHMLYKSYYRHAFGRQLSVIYKKIKSFFK